MKRKGLALLFVVVVVGSAFAQMQSYEVSQELNSLTFDVSAQLHNVHGEANAFSGTISGDPADITTAKIRIKLNPKTFDTGNAGRDKTMRDKSLEVDKYPFIEFESTSVEAARKILVADEPLQVTVKGTLKLHGLGKEISVPVKIWLHEDTITAEGDMALVLDEYEIYRPRILFFRLQNDIRIHFKIGARKTEP